MSKLTPFHLAIEVRDIAEARNFYGALLDCTEATILAATPGAAQPAAATPWTATRYQCRILAWCWK